MHSNCTQKTDRNLKSIRNSEDMQSLETIGASKTAFSSFLFSVSVTYKYLEVKRDHPAILEMSIKKTRSANPSLFSVLIMYFI